MARGITTRQAVELVSEAVGWHVTLAKLNRVITALADDGRMSVGWVDDGLVYPEDVDRISGEVWRWRPPYWQRRNVKGDYEAWVQGSGGHWRLLRLPWERVWNQAEKREDLAVWTAMEVWSWPVGEVVGALVRTDDRGGLPAYKVVPDSS
jgi:hypothetical protein